ncbi:MAG TPA: DinB family protein [Acidimicrobiales bacterium]
MRSIDDVQRPNWPTTGSEEHSLWTFVDFERATLAMKCAGLSDEQLATVANPPSTLSLLGLLRHMANNERYWYEEIFLGRKVPAHFASKTDEDADFDQLDSMSVSEVVDVWLTQCDVTRSIVKGRSLDEVSVDKPEYLESPANLRFLAMHSIEEYARHCGHADFLRQQIDGSTGY